MIKIKKNLVNMPLANPKHEKLAKNLIKCDGDKVLAYTKTYRECSLASARVLAYQILRKFPDIKHRVGELLEIQGAGLAVLNERLISLLHGKREVIHPQTGKIIELNDNNALIEALKLGYKLHGQLQSNTNINIDNRTQNLNLADGNNREDTAQSVNVIDKLNRLNKALNLSQGEQSGELSGDVVDITPESKPSNSSQPIDGT